MSKRSTRRKAAAVALTVALAGVMGAGLVAPAQASAPDHAGSAAGQTARPGGPVTLRAAVTGPAELPTYGSNADFPTWVFGGTQLCVKNRGTRYGEARVQTRLGASPEYIPVQAGTTRCVNRWWGGVPVNVRNNAYSPLSVTAR
ncbi:hypothetical protein ACFU6S_02725 [Streptomyces sp. NPDC057456]|uniref:hypothetical protein n=1 Tax=Streptomyces sp. NPDC057456 TaxID=3346139 RepID=UPI0036C306D0